MKPRSELRRLAAKVPDTLAGLLGVRVKDLDVRLDDASGADMVITAGRTFVIKIKRNRGGERRMMVLPRWMQRRPPGFMYVA
ncbi:MAG: hypothetical protein AB1486_04860 [Planctomycetota bacterium]